MIAMALIGALALYIIVVIIAVLIAIRIARNRGISQWTAAVVTALALYLLIFWDHVPTLVLHKLACAKEAAVIVGKRDSDVEMTARKSELLPKEYDRVYDMGDGIRAYWLNDQFYQTTQSVAVSTVLPVTRLRKQIVDSIDGRAIATSTAFDAGYASWPYSSEGQRMKIWVTGDACTPDEREYLRLRESLTKQRQR